MNAPDPKTGDSSTRQEGAERRLCMDIGAGRVDAVQSDTDHQLGVYGDIARGRTTKPPAGLVSSSARRRQLVVEQPHGYLRSTVPLAGKCATARPNQRCVAGMNVHVNRWLRVSWWSDLVSARSADHTEMWRSVRDSRVAQETPEFLMTPHGRWVVVLNSISNRRADCFGFPRTCCRARGTDRYDQLVIQRVSGRSSCWRSPSR